MIMLLQLTCREHLFKIFNLLLQRLAVPRQLAHTQEQYQSEELSASHVVSSVHPTSE